jgi:hypothetical protein
MQAVQRPVDRRAVSRSIGKPQTKPSTKRCMHRYTHHTHTYTHTPLPKTGCAVEGVVAEVGAEAEGASQVNKVPFVLSSKISALL